MDTLPAKRDSPITWADLDLSILKVIFEAVIPPSAFLDPTFAADSAWHTALTAKMLILVCKQWARVALPLLHSEVVFHRANQVINFAGTLGTGTMRHVRSISFSFVPSTDRTVLNTSIATILEHRRRISSIQLDPQFIDRHLDILRHRWNASDDALLAAFRNAGARIHSLTTNYLLTVSRPESSYPLDFISLFPNLRSLDLSLTLHSWAERHQP